MSWGTIKLQECCTKIGSGATPKGGKNVYLDRGVSQIRSQNVKNLEFDYSGLVSISDEAAKKLQSVSVCPEDVLLNITGDSVARVCRVPKDVLPARVNQHVAIIRTNPDMLNADYLAYYLASPFMQSYMLQLAHGKGASRNALTKDMIGKFEIPCPKINVQRRIVALLKTYDKLIENNRKQIKLLEETAQRLYKEWFVDLHFPGYETTSIANGVPEGWRRGNVGSVLGKIESGKRPKGGIDKSLKEGVPSVGAENVLGLGLYNFENEKLIPFEFAKQMKKGHVENRDILIYKDGAYTGRVSLFQDDFPHRDCVVNEHVFLVNAKHAEMQYWLFFVLQRSYEMMQSISISSAQPGINQQDVKNIPVLVPDERVLQDFDKLVSSYFSTIFLLANSNKLLKEARDRLLPKLMSGEIEV